MTGQATQGHVRVVAFAGSSDIERDDGTPLAIGLLPADARRLAACWNACEGLPTEQVEELAGIGGAAGSLRCIEEMRANNRGFRAERDQLRADLSTTKADLDAARALLTAMMADVPADRSNEVTDRVRLFMDDTNYLANTPGDHLGTIQRFAEQVTNVADILGIVVTVEQVPRLPPAMGNYDTVVSVRQARVRAW